VVLGSDEPDAADRWDRWLAPPPEIIRLAAPRELLATASAAHELSRWRDRGRAGAAKRTGRRCLVPINRDGAAPASFWTHHLFGDVSYCMYLSRHLGLDFPLWAVEQLDLDLLFTRFGSVEEMAADYVAAIREVQPDGPYVIGGASFGGVAAFEMARQLVAAGAEVSRLFLVDPIMPGTDAWTGVDASAVPEGEGQDLTLMLIGNSACQLWSVAKLLDIGQLRGRELEEQYELIARHVVAGSPLTLAHEQVRRLVRSKHEVLQLNAELLDRYQPGRLPAPVDTVVFHATRGFSGPDNPYGMPEIRRLDDDRTNGLGEFIGDRVVVHDMEADHFTIVLEENLAIIANHVRTMLDTCTTAQGR
jgi:thioesterase domain-containing protein